MTTFDAAGVGASLLAQINAVTPILLSLAGAGLLIWGGFFALDLGKKAAKKGSK